MGNRSVIYLSGGSDNNEITSETSSIGGSNINALNANENGGETPEISGDNDTEDYMSISDFSKLNATEQKKYIKELYEDEKIDYNKFYELASDYMQVIGNKNVKAYIEKLFDEMENDEE